MSSRTKNRREVRWKMTFQDCLANIYLTKMVKYRNCIFFFLRRDTVVFDGIFCQLLPLRIFLRSKTSEG